MRRYVVIACVAAAALFALSAPVRVLAAGPAINATGDPTFPDRSYRLTLPQDLALDEASVHVLENGEAPSGLVLQSADSGDSFATVLVLDASDSMNGEAIERAMAAARAFAERRAPGQRLGLVTFNSAAEVALPLSSSTDEIQAALADTPDLARGTHIYDAMATAADLLEADDVQAGSIVLLSDGADSGSTTTVGELRAAVDQAGVRVFTVGLRSNRFDPETLEEAALGGLFVEADSPADLRPVFERLGDELASEYLLTYESNIGAAEGVTVEVQVDGVEGIALDQYRSPSDGSAAGPAENESFWASNTTMLAAVGLAGALLALALFGLIRPQRQGVLDRLAPFTNQAVRRPDTAAVTRPSGPSSLVRRAIAPLERTVERGDWWSRFCELVNIAQIETSPKRIVAATAAGTIAVALFMSHGVGVPILAPLALLVPFGVRAFIRRAVKKQRKEFADQLADSLQLVASALRAGQSMAGALTIVCEEAPEPVRTEFRRIVNDEKLGVPLENAIRTVARRMQNRDMDQVALVATIQRETGGNTAEVLDQVIDTIRERGKLRRLMETLTAQGRLSQYIVSALPLVLLLAVTLINPEYMEPLFETGAGRIALGIGAVLSILGSLGIKRIVEVKV